MTYLYEMWGKFLVFTKDGKECNELRINLKNEDYNLGLNPHGDTQWCSSCITSRLREALSGIWHELIPSFLFTQQI